MVACIRRPGFQMEQRCKDKNKCVKNNGTTRRNIFRKLSQNKESKKYYLKYW